MNQHEATIEDASATYRGFRNQALYVLFRLLTDANAGEQVYRPEGAEDLAIYDSRSRLIEAVQVKDYTADLALSNLKPASKLGFFVRLLLRRKNSPLCTTKIASFGPIGPELKGAIKGDSTLRKKVTEKLCKLNNDISRETAIALLDELNGNVIHPVESELHDSVRHALEGTNVGGDLETSIELLMYWIFNASETQQYLTRDGLLAQLDRIGIYLSTLRDASAEWGVALKPIRNVGLTAEESSRLIAEYRRGIQARWEHVIACADCPRYERLEEIHDRFKAHSAVIIRGASGQGKSTLAWRYAHDYAVEGLRFHISLVESREHAIRLANALGAHVSRLQLKALVFVDVSPSDSGWPTLIKELVAAGLKVIVSIREEDFRRSNVNQSDFEYGDVLLGQLSKREASLIFKSFPLNERIQSLDFEEAWARFSDNNGGPLLEFTHFVTLGESLASRIRSQVRKIQERVITKTGALTEEHLEILALTSVANETGSRVCLTELYNEVGVNPLTAPLQALESEYLLCVAGEEERPYILGLHQLRSKAIADALFAEDSNQWVTYAKRVIPLIAEEDLEIFLLSAFSRKENCDALLDVIYTLEPKSWTQVGCVARSLVWLGLSQYEIQNRENIQKALKKLGHAWYLGCDSFVGMGAETHNDLVSLMSSLPNVEFKPFELTAKENIFVHFIVWAKQADAPGSPEKQSDWVSIGDIAHYLAKNQIFSPIRAAIEDILPNPLPTDLKFSELGQYISGRSCLSDSGLSQWHREVREEVTNMFLTETNSIHLRFDGTEIKVFYSASITGDDIDWNKESMARINKLRMLFPGYETYSSQSLGMELVSELMDHDPSTKRISRKNLQPERNIRLNATFQNLVSYRHLRPDSWHEYADQVVDFRKAASECFRKLHRGWGKLISESKPRQNTINNLPGAEMDRVKKLSAIPMFPKNAVDEWGFISEDKTINPKSVEVGRQSTINRLDHWKKTFSSFSTDIEHINSKVVELTSLCILDALNKLDEDESDKIDRIYLSNLADAWESLPVVQQEFRTAFGDLYNTTGLESLEAHEVSNLRHLWSASFALIYERRRHLENVVQVVENDIERRKRGFLDALLTEVNSALGESGTAEIIESEWVYENASCLRVICNYHRIDSLRESNPSVIEAIWRASQAGGWRPLEWKPLEIEWPKIAVINLVKGKAPVAAYVILNSATFFCHSEEFEVKPYHLIPCPIDPTELSTAGIELWDNPLLLVSLDLLIKVLAFTLTSMRFHGLAKLVVDNELNEDETNRIFDEFRHEFEAVLSAAQQSYSDASDILNTVKHEKSEYWKSELMLSCKACLYEVNRDSDILLTLDTFGTWIDGVEVAYDKLQEIIMEITSCALGE